MEPINWPTYYELKATIQSLLPEMSEGDRDQLRKVFVFEELAPPMVAFGAYARWVIHGPDGREFYLFQVSPQTTDPARHVVPFLKAIHADMVAKTVSSELPVPGEPNPVDAYQGRSVEAANLLEDSFARTMYAFWPQIVTKRPRGQVAYDWEVWYDYETCTASFQRYGPDGKVVPVHSVVRQGLDEVAEELSISDDLNNLRRGL